MPYDEVAKRATMRYLKKLKRIEFRVKPEDFERYEAVAKAAGYSSMRQFYIDAIEEKIKEIQKTY